MNNDFYYDTKTIPLVERETFNNTIILLTLIKSQYYYIVGFSRPDNMIEIAFDFESAFHTCISETMTVDFGTNEEYVLIHAILKNILPFDGDVSEYSFGDGKFSCNGGKIVYDYKVKKDKFIPKSIEQMNNYILEAKNEIITFLEKNRENYFT